MARDDVQLIRTPPAGQGPDPALAHAQRTKPERCFFHGDGVAHALDPVVAAKWAALADEAGCKLMVCETSHRRRSALPLPEPWRVGSLAQFWQAITESFPSLLRGEGQGEGKHYILVRIGAFGDERFNREVLELCLAGAALEVDLAVCFTGKGLGHLQQPRAAAWRQFPDFTLAPLCYAGNARPDVAAEHLSGDGLARLEAAAERIIDA